MEKKYTNEEIMKKIVYTALMVAAIILGLGLLLFLIGQYNSSNNTRLSAQSEYSGYQVDMAAQSGFDGGLFNKGAVAPSAAPSMGGAGEIAAYEDYSVESLVSTENEGRKTIISTDMTIQAFEFDSAIKNIRQHVADNKGFIEEANIPGKDVTRTHYLRDGYMVIRIPVSNLENFISLMGEELNVVSMRQTTQDMTSQYVDYEIQVQTLKVQEQLLLDMLSRSSELKYMLELQNQLRQIRYEIESLTSSLRHIDNQVEMTTVRLNIKEVVELIVERPAPVGFIGEIKEAFATMVDNTIDTIKRLIIWYIHNLVILVILCVLIIVVVRKIKSKKNNRIAKDKIEEVNSQTEESKEEN